MTTNKQLNSRVYDLTHIIGNLIDDAYRMANLRRNPSSALLVTFRARPDRELSLVLWSPMNYVAVMARDEPTGPWRDTLAGDWEVLCYHDCEYREGIRGFFRRYGDVISGMGIEGMRIEGVSEAKGLEWRGLIRNRHGIARVAL
jgi:hypothetical protein